MGSTSFILKLVAGIAILVGIYIFATRPVKPIQVQTIDGVVGGAGTGEAKAALARVRAQLPRSGETESALEVQANLPCKDIPKPTAPLELGCDSWSCINRQWQPRCH